MDRSTLSILVSLCENGVNPEALALVVKELRRESEALKVLILIIETFAYIFKICLESRKNINLKG